MLYRLSIVKKIKIVFCSNVQEEQIRGGDSNEQVCIKKWRKLSEPRSEKTGLQAFQPGPTQTGLCSHRKCLEA